VFFIWLRDNLRIPASMIIGGGSSRLDRIHGFRFLKWVSTPWAWMPPCPGLGRRA